MLQFCGAWRGVPSRLDTDDHYLIACFAEERFMKRDQWKDGPNLFSKRQDSEDVAWGMFISWKRNNLPPSVRANWEVHTSVAGNISCAQRLGRASGALALYGKELRRGEVRAYKLQAERPLGVSEPDERWIKAPKLWETWQRKWQQPKSSRIICEERYETGWESLVRHMTKKLSISIPFFCSGPGYFDVALPDC